MTVRQASAGNRSGAARHRAATHGDLLTGSGLPPALTYAATIRRAMDALHVSAADLAGATGYSYEQLRRILKGEPIVSEQLNQLLCARLGLDFASTWSIALQEKAVRRLAPQSGEAAAQDQQRHLLAGFARLSDAGRQRVLRLLHRLEHEREPKGKNQE